ncbi:hypothetical protein PFICI_04856 [Pestalotiopsis fici W106-1]|uniref:Uncharacterized protein n=1 Tax=Pestalotiopsis fici (strain W106-1 / CGMCC3.15140) TaxID=1229662 RepID=W3XA97_PESFW|nr:uncharacterized protein PFICI_04856 [Pestalotiopsis fici W106-1]ETS82980.1 hypothetical protein PFICI_04856 [Pestalotiopsis fici W106-1]
MDYAIGPLDDPWVLRRSRTQTLSWRPPLYTYSNVLEGDHWHAEPNSHPPRRVKRGDIPSFDSTSYDRSALGILGFDVDDGQHSIVEDVDYTKYHERPGDWKELCHLMCVILVPLTLPAVENLNYYVSYKPGRASWNHYWSPTGAKRDSEALLEYFMTMNHIQEPSQLLPLDARAALFYNLPGLMVHSADYQERYTEYAQRASPRSPKLPSAFYSWDREQNTLPGLYFSIFYLKKAGKRDGSRLWGTDSKHLQYSRQHLMIQLVEQAVFNLWDPSEIVTIKISHVEFYLEQNIRTLGMVRTWVLRNYKAVGKEEEPLSAEYVQVIDMFDSKIPEMISKLELLLGSAIASLKEAGDASAERLLRLSTNQLQLGFVSQNTISSATTLVLIFIPLIFVSY